MRKYILLIIPFIFFGYLFIVYQKMKNPVGPIGNGINTHIAWYTWVGYIGTGFIFINGWYLSFRMFKQERQQSRKQKK